MKASDKLNLEILISEIKSKYKLKTKIETLQKVIDVFYTKYILTEKLRRKLHYKSNKEYYRQARIKWRKKNPDKVKAYSTSESAKEYQREYQRKYREANKRKILEYHKQYNQLNKAKIKKYANAYYHANKNK